MTRTRPSSPHALLLALVGLGGLGLGPSFACATTGDTLSGEPEAPGDGQTEPKADDAWAERTMTKLEQRLVSAERVEIGFEIQSSGAFGSQLAGTLSWTADGQMDLVARGDFGGEAQELELHADAERLVIRVGGETRHEGERPAALVEAVVLGFTRQGLLHNLALLTAGLPPEHGAGGIAQWLAFVEPQLGAPESFGAGEARALEFQIEVAGKHVGHASLWLRDDLPLERRQRVEFADGTMEVVERYTDFAVE